ncbi:hypothetical protein YC2023_046921 [Brassica napus]
MMMRYTLFFIFLFKGKQLTALAVAKENSIDICEEHEGSHEQLKNLREILKRLLIDPDSNKDIRVQKKPKYVIFSGPELYLYFRVGSKQELDMYFK